MMIFVFSYEPKIQIQQTIKLNRNQKPTEKEPIKTQEQNREFGFEI